MVILNYNTYELKKEQGQTAEYGKWTPEIFFLKYHCTPDEGCGTFEYGCGSIV